MAYHGFGSHRIDVTFQKQLYFVQLRQLVAHGPDVTAKGFKIPPPRNVMLAERLQDRFKDAREPRYTVPVRSQCSSVRSKRSLYSWSFWSHEWRNGLSFKNSFSVVLTAPVSYRSEESRRAGVVDGQRGE
ncbi:hypothetical protein TTRE_0000886501 [Trichuris trichiura]|uniref:Uncharacterized protein n=1 Tax=Trichuris trichiura TaxID=36087 RepID=A0A077ZL55_TRITR|nr:hypothetical protein TTRE_0000886501 [Trichuris trichiura]